MDQKQKVKKFLTLLKGAQNSAFVGLACDNLRIELQQKPWKVMKILDFLLRETVRANADFTRLKLAEGLIPLLSELQPQQLTQTLLSHATSEKGRKQLLESSLIIEVPALSEKDRLFFTFSDMLKSRKNIFSDLLEQYQPLLAEINVGESTPTVSTGGGAPAKDSIKQMFMEGVIGNRLQTDKLKLSDFIDESFFDDVVLGSDDEDGSASISSRQLKFINEDLIEKELKQLPDNQVLLEVPNKRVKTGAGIDLHNQSLGKFILLSPLLAILIKMISKNSMLDCDWKVRQHAVNCVRLALKHASSNKSKPPSLDYFIITTSKEGELSLMHSCQIPLKILVKALFPHMFLAILKDHFNDFEELKVITPVREESVSLLVTIIELKLDEEDVTSLLQALPNLLKAIDSQVSPTWITKYNFFLFLKAFFVQSKAEDLRNQTFTMFSRVLIESLTNLEDEVRILVTDILNQTLPLHLAQSDQHMSKLLKNLQRNLKQSDEIESSAISVFALINRIIDEGGLERKEVKFKFDSAVFCPFNFHQIVNVRYSYLQIVNKCLQAGTPIIIGDIYHLTQLTLQSLAMERSKPIVKLNLANLRLLIKRFKECLSTEHFINYLNHLFSYDQIMPYLIYAPQICSFDIFLFFESRNFESINRDYYKIVFRPVSQEEIQKFYYGKMKNLSKALSVLMEHSQEACSVLVKHLEAYMLPPPTLTPGLQAPVHEAHLFYLLSAMWSLLAEIKDKKISMLDTGYFSGIVNMFLTQFTEEQVSINHFKDLERLQTVMGILHEQLNKSPAKFQTIILLMPQLYQLMDTCYIEHKLKNIAAIQSFIEQQLEPLFTPYRDSNPEVFDCFNEMRQLYTQLIEYASATCSRIRQVSAMIHLSLAQISQEKYPLTSQLNNLIKPMLNQLKKETVPFMQTIAANGTASLISQLLAIGKVKPAQQILSIIVKDIEAIGVNAIQDRGLRAMFKTGAKDLGNLLQAYGSYFRKYFEQPLTFQSAKVVLFILETIRSNQTKEATMIYTQEDIQFLAQLACSLLQKCQEQPINDLPSIFSLLFSMFPQSHSKLISSMVQGMENKNKESFEILIRLLSDTQESQLIATQSEMGSAFLKFIPVFVIPVIKNIQYSRTIFGDDKQITLILAQLLSLLPLNLASLHGQQKSMVKEQEETKESEEKQYDGINDAALMDQAQEGFQFLQIFVNNQIGAETYELSIPVNAHLRDYQRQGITWLAALGRFNLNCALCDDMGLGKTLQSLCVVLNESHLRREALKGKEVKKGSSTNGAAAAEKLEHVINLIVCPTTITYNWKVEIDKYFPKLGVRVAIYEGNNQARMDIISNYKKYDVIIASYEKLRNDVKHFQTIHFFYVILDEAHIIKNSKAKTTQAVKAVQCEKKLVLTGTPLQNKVSELWSIFDFLMPGYLEEESVFNKKYNQYLTSNIKKLSEKLEETQTFVNALKSLKKRIQPFILRRTKDQVLKELPPKIIQDVVCKMTSFQEHVHGIIDKNHPIIQTLQQQQQQVTQQQKQQGKQVLQNLILHRKVCNHPMLVARDAPSCLKDKSVATYLQKKSEVELLGHEQSGKLLGLYDKLVECEIIERDEEVKATATATAVDTGLFADIAETAMSAVGETQPHSLKKHRALIFCQMGTFLRMIVEQVLVKFNVPYLELLSSHSAKDRVDIVEHFNTDESIRVLILTTAVGGLGLTLTGADTVIFAEHDWNPMRDLQAIDRAHRIGQTRQVCVYRLIMQDTLEEKIMNLQRFKENLARSLVQARDTSVEGAAGNMELTDLLQSFQEHSAFQQDGQKPQKKGKEDDKNGFEDKIISNIEEIWQGGAFSVEDL